MRQSIRVIGIVIAFGAAALAQDARNNMLTDEEKAAGWTLLFDGKGAPGMRGVQKREPFKAGWQIKDGELILPKEIKNLGKITGGDLTTAETFLDFEFSFDWKLAVSSNTGIRYLVRMGSNNSVVGCEYQIIDDVHHPEGLKGGPLRRTGALDGIIAPSADKQLNEPEQWNRGRIVVQGNHVEHWLNGAKVVEFELGSRALMSSAQTARVKVPTGFGSKFKSAIVILDQGDEFTMRNLKLRKLPPAVAPIAGPVPALLAPAREAAPDAPSPARRHPPVGAPTPPLAPTPPDLK